MAARPWPPPWWPGLAGAWAGLLFMPEETINASWHKKNWLKLATSSWKVSYCRQLDTRAVAPFSNRSNCIIHALIQSEMERPCFVQLLTITHFSRRCATLGVPRKPFWTSIDLKQPCNSPIPQAQSIWTPCRFASFLLFVCFLKRESIHCACLWGAGVVSYVLVLSHVIIY